MPWYFIILIFFLNILFGIGFFYSLLLILFHPKKKRKFFGIRLPRGILYHFRNKLTDYISKQFEIYIEFNSDELNNSKPKKIVEDISEKITNALQNKKWFKSIPNFLSNPIIKFVSDVSYFLLDELLTNFVPNLVQRYKIKDRIFELLSDKNIQFIEFKAKMYLTKPLVIIGAILGFIFGIFNMIMMYIF